jgi:hypothetical protein
LTPGQHGVLACRCTAAAGKPGKANASAVAPANAYIPWRENCTFTESLLISTL